MDDKRPLWAPWRIDFILSEKEKRCFLCNQEEYNEESQEEELIIVRNEHVYVILNRYPYNPGHLLISPYRHIGDLDELTQEESHALMDTVRQAQKVLKKLMNPNGFNVGFNLGVDAGAGVADHIHMHIVPRWRGDNNFMPVIGETRVVPEALCATANALRKEWKEMFGA